MQESKSEQAEAGIPCGHQEFFRGGRPQIFVGHDDSSGCLSFLPVRESSKRNRAENPKEFKRRFSLPSRFARTKRGNPSSMSSQPSRYLKP
jgi:hypothetical protein